MAKIDLTFDELNTALGGAAITQSGDDIIISVKAVTGDTKDALANEGVIEFLYKLRSACGVAQDTANDLEVAGDQLDSFPGFSFSPPADGYVSVTQSQTVRTLIGRSRRLGIRGQKRYQTKINWRVVIYVWSGSELPDLNSINQSLARLQIIESKLDQILILISDKSNPEELQGASQAQQQFFFLQ